MNYSKMLAGLFGLSSNQSTGIILLIVSFIVSRHYSQMLNEECLRYDKKSYKIGYFSFLFIRFSRKTQQINEDFERVPLKDTLLSLRTIIYSIINIMIHFLLLYLVLSGKKITQLSMLVDNALLLLLARLFFPKEYGLNKKKEKEEKRENRGY